MLIWPLGYYKYEMEKSAFKVYSLPLSQWPIGPEIIKITPLRLQNLIKIFHSTIITHNELWFCKNLKIDKNHSQIYFQLYLHYFEVLHRSISFWYNGSHLILRKNVTAIKLCFSWHAVCSIQYTEQHGILVVDGGQRHAERNCTTLHSNTGQLDFNQFFSVLMSNMKAILVSCLRCN